MQLKNSNLVVNDMNTELSLTQYFKSLKMKVTEGHSGQSKPTTMYLKKFASPDLIKNIMQIGFNGGHSAETYIDANPYCHVVSFDIGRHKYLNYGSEFIHAKYPGRHELILGNSKKTVPLYVKNNDNRTFDLIFIDGGHSRACARSDIKWSWHLAHPDTVVIMDDVVKKPEWVRHWTQTFQKGNEFSINIKSKI